MKPIKSQDFRIITKNLVGMAHATKARWRSLLICPLGRDRRLTPAGFFFSPRLPTTITEAALENW